MMRGQIVLQVFATTVIELLRAARIAIAKMVQANGDLNQPLKELARGPLVVGPEFLPNVMRLEELALIKKTDPRKIAGVVSGFVQNSARIK